MEPFKVAYQKRMEIEEYGRWKAGIYVQRAINSCFGGEYPEQPYGVGNSRNTSSEDEEKEGYQEEKISEQEMLIMQLAILEGRNKREKARQERQKLREQQQESESE